MVDAILLKYEMEKHGFNVKQLAEKMGIQRQALYMKLKGNTAFSLEDVRKIKKICGLSNERIIEIFFAE